MNKAEFLRDLEVNIKIINTNISIGLSVNKIAPELFACREDNIRKWLKGTGYTRDKISKLFVLSEPETSNKEAVSSNTTKDYKPVTETNKSSYKSVTEDTENNYEIVSNSKNKKSQEDIKSYKLIEASQEPSFSFEDMEIIKELVERQKAIKMLLGDTDKGQDKVHSIRCYSNIYSKFKESCEIQNLRIQDALYIALNNYINKK